MLKCVRATKYLRVVKFSGTRQGETTICALVLTVLVPIMQQLIVDVTAIITSSDKGVADWKALKLNAKPNDGPDMTIPYLDIA